MFRFVSILFRNCALLIIYLYRIIISPFLPNVCIYEVSCSKYAIDAFKNNNFFKALWLTIKRIISCHPWAYKNK